MAAQGQMCEGRRTTTDTTRAMRVATPTPKNTVGAELPMSPVAAASATDPPVSRKTTEIEGARRCQREAPACSSPSARAASTAIRGSM